MNVKKLACVLLVFMAAETAVLMAQSSGQVDDWLRTAEQKAQRAYSLAQRDASGNEDAIASLVSDVRSTLLRIENYILSGNQLTSRQEDRLQNINADLFSIQRLMDY
jgi:hypothetical protein